MDFLSVLNTMPLAGIDSLWISFKDSDFLGRLIVIVQFGISVYGIGLIVQKTQIINGAERQITRFRDFFKSIDLVLGHHFARGTAKSPAINIYFAGTNAIVNEFRKEGAKINRTEDAVGLTLSEGSMGVIENAVDDALVVEDEKLTKNLTTIATIASIEPMIGLFGTVWGVLDAFQSMGRSGTVNLAEVAPGLSSAMLTTFVGLLIAIPMLLAYNTLAEKRRKILSELNAFSDQFLSRANAEFKR